MGDIHAEFLIGADGARSRVAERFGLSRNRHFLTGLEIECEPLTGVDERFLHCFADSKIAPGYIAWVVPGVGATQIGLAASRGHRPDLGGLLRRLKAHYDIREIRVTARRSGLIPSGGVVKTLGTERVLLVGDAAGMVSPVTGGGIHTALHFGRRAAILACEYLGARGPHPVAAIAKEVPRYRAKLLLRRALDLAPPNALINVFFMSRPMRALAQRLYFHSRGESAQSFQAWSEAFARGQVETEKPKLWVI
jgi:flavin-dependent dehydrogenase